METLYLNLNIPNSFRVAPFYKDQRMVEHVSVPEQISFNTPFLYDLMYHHDPQLLERWPWQKSENYFHDYWVEQKESLCELFHRREQKKARKPMILSVSAFIDQLYWAAGAPVNSLEHETVIQKMQTIPSVPLNIEERLRFLLLHPDRYQSFIQLDEMEQEFTKKRSAYLRRHASDH
ncbi:YpoC family protein [Sporolactobacillus sp. STCC-11]|uniref:YpoC family protein n=1 Tax=Sporolactobacillus caesalpiniae TaxID=3230362 RepID=UPI003397D04E